MLEIWENKIAVSFFSSENDYIYYTMASRGSYLSYLFESCALRASCKDIDTSLFNYFYETVLLDNSLPVGCLVDVIFSCNSNSPKEQLLKVRVEKFVVNEDIKINNQHIFFTTIKQSLCLSHGSTLPLRKLSVKAQHKLFLAAMKGIFIGYTDVSTRLFALKGYKRNLLPLRVAQLEKNVPKIVFEQPKIIFQPQLSLKKILIKLGLLKTHIFFLFGVLVRQLQLEISQEALYNNFKSPDGFIYLVVLNIKGNTAI